MRAYIILSGDGSTFAKDRGAACSLPNLQAQSSCDKKEEGTWCVCPACLLSPGSLGCIENSCILDSSMIATHKPAISLVEDQTINQMHSIKERSRRLCCPMAQLCAHRQIRLDLNGYVQHGTGTYQMHRSQPCMCVLRRSTASTSFQVSYQACLYVCPLVCTAVRTRLASYQSLTGHYYTNAWNATTRANWAGRCMGAEIDHVFCRGCIRGQKV